MKKLATFFCLILSVSTLCSCKLTADNSLKTNMSEHLIQVTASSDFSTIAEKIAPAIVGVLSTTNKSESVGSGVCVASGGFILTNAHVLSNTGEISLHLFDGTSTSAELIFNDPTSDIAILKSSKTLPYLSLSNNAPKVGEDVMAVGTPLSLLLKHSFTKGIVSALNRTLAVSSLAGESYMHNLIQHDASLNPGNSGGPLVNSKGEVVGINTLKITSGEGIGFAIPTQNFSSILNSFVTSINYETPYLGVFGYDAEIANYYQLTNVDNGVYVINTDKNSPIYNANVKTGDIIAKFNDKKIKNILDLREELYKCSATNSATIEIIRDNEVYEITIPLSKRPN